MSYPKGGLYWEKMFHRNDTFSIGRSAGNARFFDGYISECRVWNVARTSAQIEDGVFLGPSCVFTNDLTPRARYPKGSQNYVKTMVCDGASIGANATIVCGHTIGRNAMIAAGAVVTKDVPPHALMLGIPAEQRGWVCECGSLLNKAFICAKCKRKYLIKPEGLVEWNSEI